MKTSRDIAPSFWGGLLLFLLLASCERPASASGVPDREALPAVAVLPDLDPPVFPPEPIAVGGGAIPLEGVLEGGGKSAGSDEAGRPWWKTGSRPFRVPRRLADTHFMMVLDPGTEAKSVHGLLGGGGRNWNNFVELSFSGSGDIGVWNEDPGGATKRGKLAAAKAPPAGGPALFEIIPGDGRTSRFAVDGVGFADLLGDTRANRFGAGYATHPDFSGRVGEIRIYAGALSKDERADVSMLVRSWWGLEGGVEDAFAAGFREEPVLLGRVNNAARSGGLTVRRAGTSSEPAMVFLGASGPGPAGIDDLPEGATVVLGRTWRIHSGEQPSVLHFSFDQATSLGGDHLGEHGFYALVRRTSADSEWQRVGATLPTWDGQIHFPEIEVEGGEYGLAIMQGIPTRKNPGRLQVNGSDGPEVACEAGTHLELSARSAEAGQTLELVDEATGATWYAGPAEELKLAWFALRRRETVLEARFSGASGVLPGSERITIRLTGDALYPGLLGQVVRGGGKPVEPDDFAPEVSWPTGFDAGNYPAFRTAESIHTPPFSERSEPWWTPPYYFHGILPTLRIGGTAEEIVADGAIPRQPFGDLRGGRHGRFSGVLLLPKAGEHGFRLECDAPGTLRIGTATTQTGPDACELTVTANQAGAVDFELVLSPTEGGVRTRLFWRPPGGHEYRAAPNHLLAHPVGAAMEESLSRATKGFAHRKATVSRSMNDEAAALLLESVEPEQIGASTANFAKAVGPLAGAFLQGRGLAENPAAAERVFDLIGARIRHLRKHPKQMAVGWAGKTDGALLKSFEGLRPFLSFCESHPAYQSASLDARAELAQFAVATCLSRSFFGEGHTGANDGYNDDNNLLVNFWRAASALDDPYARDAATCLQGSHFRHAPGRAEGVTTDGIFTFHNVNGRQMHPLGYGTSWFNRVLRRRDTTTPWRYTPEQYRRLGEFLLAAEWIYYRGTQCWFANGRHNTHRGSGAWVGNAASRIASLPEGIIRDEDRTRLHELAARIKADAGNSVTGHRFFHRNLYTVHRRKDYFIDLKMTSPLVGTIESFAGMLNWNMSFGDGVTTLMKTGKEYHGIHSGNAPNAAYAIKRGVYRNPGKFPQAKNPLNPCLWQFRALPGTVKLDDEVHAPERYRGGFGSTAGGVSDGELGHAAFHFRLGSAGAEARKFHAFTEDGMFVLNCGIHTLRKKGVPKDVTLRTNLNQCDWETDVRIVRADGEEVVVPHAGDGRTLRLPLDQSYWIEQGAIGYLVLPTGAEGGDGRPGTLVVEAGMRTPLTPVPGLKYTDAQIELIRTSVPPDRREKVFHLWIDHGQQVEGGSSTYFVCMRPEEAEVVAWLRESPLEILCNSADLQAVRDRRDGTTHAFFRGAGELSGPSGELLVASPCPAAVMWRPETRAVTVQDPVAACTGNASAMTDVLELHLGAGLAGVLERRALSIVLPGANDADDRYRGAPVTKVME